MTGAFLTTLLFSLSVIFANRSIRALGAMRANLGRLTLAVIVLGLFAHTLGNGLHGAGLPWFLLSGVIGMGLGDLALYGALPRLGSRLTLLMTQCLAAPIAALTEWLWLGVTLSLTQLLAGIIILIGVALALLPEKKSPDSDTPSTSRDAPRVSLTMLGITFGALSAAGQGLGAVMSRKANLTATLAGESTAGISLGITAAYQRILAGFVITAAWFFIQYILTRHRSVKNTSAASTLSDASTVPAAATASISAPLRTWRSYVWVPLNAFSGPILGVSCYQWALATTASGIVLPIVACTPLVIIPLAYWLEGERPTARSILGAIIAVLGVVALSAA
jgi:drug/metabolite transporter (DMT)-like permease